MKRFIAGFIFAAAFLLQLAPPFKAASPYYYATAGGGGNDSNPGTLASPFLTPERCAIAIGPAGTAAGGICYGRQGTYNGAVGGSWTQIPHGIDWNNPVKFLSYNGEAVKWTNSGSAASVLGFATDIYPTHRSFYWEVHDVEMDGTGSTADSFVGGLSGDFVRLVNVHVHGAPHQGIEPHADYWDLWNVEVDHCGTVGNPTPDHGVYSPGAHLTVLGGSYHHNASYGLQIYDQGSAIVSFNAVVGARIYSNNIGNTQGGGMIMAQGQNNIAINNLIYKNGQNGLDLHGLQPFVFNNTIVGNTGGSIVLGSDSDAAQIQNNAIDTAVQNNSNNPGPIGNNYLVTTGLFTNYAADDYTLPVGSPLAGFAVDLTRLAIPFSVPSVTFGATYPTLLLDLASVARPDGSAWSAGAYQVPSGVTASFSISLSSRAQGTTGNHTLSGTATGWINGTTAFSTLCPGVTVNSTTVTNATTATVNLTVSGGATVAFCNIKMTTNAAIETLVNGLNVTASGATFGVSPASAVQGTSGTLTLTGSATSWVNATSALTSNCVGMTIPSTTVSGSTAATATFTLAANATLGTCTLTMTTGAEVETLTLGFSINAPSTGFQRAQNGIACGLAAASQTTIVCTLATNPLTGHPVLFGGQFYDGTMIGPTVSSVVDSAGNAYTLAPCNSGNNRVDSAGYVWVAYLLSAPANATKAITVTYSKSLNYAALFGGEFISPPGLPTYDACAVAGAATGPVTTPSVTITGTHELLFAVGGATTTLGTPTSSWIQNEGGNINGGQAGAAYILDVSANKAAAWPADAAQPYNAVIVALRSCLSTSLSFVLQPAATALNGDLGTVTVKAVDANGLPCTSNTATVTLSKNSSSTWGGVGGTLIANMVNGVATFTGLSITGNGGLGSIDANSTGLTRATSSSLTIGGTPTGTGGGYRMRGLLR